MCDAVLALDAGGTSIKLALMDGHGEPVADTERQYTFAGDSRESLAATFQQALQEARQMAEARRLSVRGIGAACPGPFDFRRGVSRMTHKWPGLHGVPLIPLFQEVFEKVEPVFLHDSTAFLLGEKYRGAGRAAQNPSGVMLGTGFGYACMRHGRVLLDESLAPILRLWCSPFDGGIVEDAVSRRALRRRYWEKAHGSGPEGSALPDVREIAELARGGDKCALAAFAETGRLLGRILARYLPTECDLVVVGGQISRSADLFLPYAQEALAVPVAPAAHIADAALYGVYHYCTHQPDETTREVRP